MGSGGAGVEVNLLAEIPEGQLTESLKVKLKSVLVPQPSPEAAYRLEMAMLKKGFYFRDAPLFDEAFRKYNAPEFPSARNQEMGRMMDQPLKILTDRDVAVILPTRSQAMGPVFLIRQNAGWIIDRTAVLKTIVYDYSNERWYAIDSDSRYLQLLKTGIPMTQGKLGSGKKAWMPTQRSH